MTIHLISSTDDLKHYDQWVRAHPSGSLWQSTEWKRFQEAVGREVKIYMVKKDGHIVSSALVVIDRTAFGYCTWDIPRGPLWGMQNLKCKMKNELLATIVQDAKKDRCVCLYFSPCTPIQYESSNVQCSTRNEQPAATRVIDLTQSQEDILKHMKPKGRYNIRVAEKHGIKVNASTDTDAFYTLLRATGQRDRFTPLSKAHYETFLGRLDGSFLLLAYADQSGHPEHCRRAIAALIGVSWGKKAYYYYGASSYAERATMSPYLLQWEAIKRCKESGCTTYDLLGISIDPKHPWTGVSAFKEKFGGDVVTYPPEQEIVLRPIIKTLLTFKRKLIK